MRTWVTSQEKTLILHARKDGGDNENREKGGIFWKSFDIKNLCKLKTN